MDEPYKTIYLELVRDTHILVMHNNVECLDTTYEFMVLGKHKAFEDVDFIYLRYGIFQEA
jgi:hypothetical protein